MQHVAVDELLVKVEDPFCALSIENKSAWCCTHVLSSVSTPMPLTALPAKQNQKGTTISFHHPLPNKLNKYMTNLCS
jgi:hypothetical protein